MYFYDLIATYMPMEGNLEYIYIDRYLGPKRAQLRILLSHLGQIHQIDHDLDHLV